MSYSFSNVGLIFSTNAEDVTGPIYRLSDAVQSVGTSASSAGALADTNWGRFGATLGRVSVMGIVAMDRLEISQEAVANAQMRAELSQQRYTDAVAKWGPTSEQATRAHKELEISMRAVGIAQERENIRTLIMAGVVIPQMVAGVYRMLPALAQWVAGTDAVTGATIALTNAQRILLATSIVGIPLLIAGLAFSAGAFGGGGGGTPNVNVYGNVNMSSPTTPTGFGTTASDWSRTVSTG